MKCKLLDIEINTSKICPASKNLKKKFRCYKDCGFSPLRDKNKKIIVQTRLSSELEVYIPKKKKRKRKKKEKCQSLF